MMRLRSSSTTLSRSGRWVAPMFKVLSKARSSHSIGSLHTVSEALRLVVVLMSLARKPLYAPRGAVATSQPLAASTGLSVLRRGGNAVDAALATAITLTVVQPGSNDIGGDLFAIVWDGATLHGLNAPGRSPAALPPDPAPVP